MKRRDQNTWAVIAGLLVASAAVVWFAPMRVSEELRLPGKLYATSVWTLERSGQGTLNARVDDRRGGVSTTYLIQSVERGDVARFDLLPSVRVGAHISAGDTMGVLISAASEREVAELSSAISIAASESAVLNSGQKQELIDAALARLKAVQDQLALQERIVARIRQLVDGGMAATDELEREQAQVVSFRGQIATLQAEIDVLKTGARPTERQLAATRLEASRKQLEALSKLRGAFVVTAPHGGLVARPAGDSVLVRLTDTSGWIAMVPVPVDARTVFEEDKAVSLEGIAGSVSGRVGHLDRTVYTVGGRPSLLATIVLDSLPVDALDGQGVTVIGQSEPRRLRDRIMESFSGVFNWRGWLSNAPRV